MRSWGPRLLIAGALIVAGATGYFAWKGWSPSEPDRALTFEVRWQNQWLRLARTSETTPWAIVAAQPPLPAEVQANPNQVMKILDLMAALLRSAKEDSAISHDTLEQAGVIPPALALVAGATQFHFGRRNGPRAYLYRPDNKRLIMASPSLLDYFQRQGIEGLLDLRLTAFETDDIESLKAQGQCRALDLQRDGDHWVVHSGGLSSGAVDEYLDRITNISRKPVAQGTATPSTPPWCEITIRGRDSVAHSIRIWHGPDGALMTAAPGGGLFQVKATDLVWLD